MIYGYVRVSCDKQTTENQIFEIKNFAQLNNITVDYWINETISGTKDVRKRKLGQLLKKLRANDVLVCCEISRLGRNLMQVMSFLSWCMERNIAVWTIKDNYRLSSDLQSKILAFAFSLSAEIERMLISQRTKEALARIKSEGKSLGRPKGNSNKQLKILGQEHFIRQSLNKKIPLFKIAENLDVSSKTLKKTIINKLNAKKAGGRFYIP